MPSKRTKNSPKSGRGLSHVTPTIFGIWSNISQKLLELETSNLVHGFVWRMTSRRTKISRKTGRGLGHVAHTIFGSTVGYPSDSLASCMVNWQTSSLWLCLGRFVHIQNYGRSKVSFLLLQRKRRINFPHSDMFMCFSLFLSTYLIISAHVLRIYHIISRPLRSVVSSNYTVF